MAKSALLHTWPQNVPGNMSSSSLAHGHCPWLCFSPSALLPLPLYSVTIPILSPLLTGVLVHHCASEQILPPRHKCGAQGATEDGGGSWLLSLGMAQETEGKHSPPHLGPPAEHMGHDLGAREPPQSPKIHILWSEGVNSPSIPIRQEMPPGDEGKTPLS
jgi:hypothetical protein